MNGWGATHLILSALAVIIGPAIGLTLYSVGYRGAELLPSAFLFVAGTWGMFGWLGVEN